MSFASILSGPTEEERPPPKRPSPPPPAPVAPVAPPPPPFALTEQKYREPEPAPPPLLPKLEEKPVAKERRRNVEQEPPVGNFLLAPPSANGAAAELNKTPPQARAPAPRKTLSERDLEIINKISADIDNEEKSDVEAPGYEAEFERYVSKGKKRAMNTERNEGIKRKVCFYSEKCFLLAGYKTNFYI